MLSIIVAMGQRNEIGQNNRLLCHLSDDLKNFKRLTTGHTVIMGHNTFLSLPIRPLPKRRNIILTSKPNLQYNDCIVVHSLDETLALCPEDDEHFIIGGGSLYKQSIDLCDKLYVTRINAEFPEADTFFPVIDTNCWQLVSEEPHQSDEHNGYDFSFQIYLRK